MVEKTVKHLIGTKSHFSLGESILDPEYIAKQAAELGYESVGICDTNNINALVNFAKTAKDKGLEAVIGVNISVVDDIAERPEKGSKKRIKSFRVGMYVKNDDGLKELFQLLTMANDEAHFYYTPRISFDELLGALSTGNLIVTTGCFFPLFSMSDYNERLRKMKAVLRHERDLYVELSPIDSLYHDRINALAIKAVTDHRIWPVFTRPTLHKRGQAKIRTIMNCVVDRTESKPIFKKEAPSCLHIPSETEYNDEIRTMFERLIERGDCDNASATAMTHLADKATAEFHKYAAYRWKKLDPCLPSLAADPFAELCRLVKEGWSERITEEVMGYKPDASEIETYKKRLSYELGVLKKMGFENYFLLVHKIVSWSKANGIMVGPGRGSVGGSLVAYLLHITDVDPIRFGLFFERFINPDRIDLPDADLDFMSSRRKEIIHYATKEWGEARVAGISNYSTLGPSSALRSVGKTYGLNDAMMECAKYVPKENGIPFKLEESMKMVPSIEKFAIDYPAVFEEACGLQDVFRNYGQHAAGVVIAGEDIVGRAVLERRTEDMHVCNWDKQYIEEWGLIKLDILGLSNLDILKLASDYVKDETGKPIEYTKIPLDDPAVYEAFGKGETHGVFQFESGGMRKLLRDLATNDLLTFEDITAATALYRPGPMQSGLLEKFVSIKKGFDVPTYDHPNMNAALSETYSVIVYQEQVMQLARDLAGFTMTESDHLRKAMGKKDKDKMAKMRDKWVQGCVKHSGMTEGSAGHIFDLVEKFAGYGFNKSHSVEYTVISYWTMWLKVHHPEAFFAACLTILDSDKHAGLVKDAARFGIELAPPDVNISTDRFVIQYDPLRAKRMLYMPFQAVKGISDASAKLLAEARQKVGKFKDKAHFLASIDKRKCNARAQEALERVGAFVSVTPGSLDARHPDRLRDQKELLGDLIAESVKANRKIDQSPYTKGELIKLVNTTMTCTDCTLAGKRHCVPSIGRSAKIMVVTEAPTWKEVDQGRIGFPAANEPIKEALAKHGFKMSDCYFTSLVKSEKERDGSNKTQPLTNEQMNGCYKYLKREIELLKPPVILLLGSPVIKFFYPDMKGSAEDLNGTTIYDAKLDATVIMAISQGSVSYDAGKQHHLDSAVQLIADMFT